MMGDLSGPRLSNRGGGPALPSYRGPRDALMVSGFDILGQNRALQVHWAKRVAGFALDCIVVLAPVSTALFLLGERRIVSYGVLSGLVFWAYSTVGEALARKTLGKTLA